MRPFDIMTIIREALRKREDMEVTGSGAFTVQPYSSDLSIKIGNQKFSITVELTGEESAAV